MRVAVCQLSNHGGIVDDEWDRLVDKVLAAGADLLVLPEMPFTRWLAADYRVVADQWTEAVDRSAAWLDALGGFQATAVVGTRPVVDAATGEARNRGFVVDRSGTRDLHDKALVPDEPGWWEARWYRPGDVHGAPFGVGDASVGLLICSELWAMDQVRTLGAAGVDLLVVPRATGHDSLETWLAGLRTAAVVAGSYVVSSNLYRPPGGVDLGGMGVVISPDGDLLGVTDTTEPTVVVELDLAVAAAAKSTYPRTLFGPVGGGGSG